MSQILDDDREPQKNNGSKIILGLLLIFMSWLSFGVGYSVSLPYSLNSVLIFASPVLFIGGLILAFLSR